jgi:hypothetical protein
MDIQAGGTLDLSTSTTAFNVGTNQTLKGSGTLQGTATVSGTLAPGGASIGPLTVYGNLTNQATAVTKVRLNKTLGTNDNVNCSGAISFGGTLVVTNVAGSLTTSDTFKLFSASGGFSGNFGTIVGNAGSGLAYVFNPTNGILSVVAATASNPTNITFVVSGNTMTLSWPLDHLGWILQSQTNALNKGLFTNWVDVAGSDLSTQAVVNLTVTNPSVFYRLRNP